MVTNSYNFAFQTHVMVLRCAARAPNVKYQTTEPIAFAHLVTLEIPQPVVLNQLQVAMVPVLVILSHIPALQSVLRITIVRVEKCVRLENVLQSAIISTQFVLW